MEGSSFSFHTPVNNEEQGVVHAFEYKAPNGQVVHGRVAYNPAGH
jgi:hypothetical protein